MNTATKTAAAIGLLGLAVIIIIFGPLFTIWSWNQLFGDLKMIEYNFWNWLAVAGFALLFRGIRFDNGKK
jgi:hypothetical protein